MRRPQKLPTDTHVELLVLFYAAVAVVIVVLTLIFW
jgi:hypothetical protein